MKKLRVLVSLSTDANDFQREQAKAAEEAGARLGVETKIVYAQNDAITQSEQLLQAIQGELQNRPDAILVEPCGRTGFPQVARAAASAGIGWGMLNWVADYIGDLRAHFRVPVFTLSSDHHEIGRIQGRQLAALLPHGGSVLYIQGPSSSPAAQERTVGMQETKPENIQVRLLKTDGWTEDSAQRSLSAWLRLSTSQKILADVVMGQCDLLAIGARKTMQEHNSGTDGKAHAEVVFTGVDGLPGGGQKWVQKGLLAATVIVPTNAGSGLELMVRALRTGEQPPDARFTVPSSYPALGFTSRPKGGIPMI
jgi:ribose transport system substrate-binding protein